MRILIYDDYIYNKGLLTARLKASWPRAVIDTIDAERIQAGGLAGADLFIMPGGADLYFCEKLNGAPNAAIRGFIEAGGAYLGICAGAYYGAAQLCWAKNEGTHAIAGGRELGLIDALAVGPVYDYLQDRDFRKCWDGICRLDDGGEVFPALYRGGCYFELSDPRAEILARYDDLPGRPPAVLYKAVGKGRAVLSGPHIELTAGLYRAGLYRQGQAPETYDYQIQIAETLTTGKDAGGRFWHGILEKLLGKETS